MRRADLNAGALASYQRLRAATCPLGCDFFEGLGMKRAESACRNHFMAMKR